MNKIPPQDHLKKELINRFSRFVYSSEFDSTLESVKGFLSEMYSPEYVEQLSLFELTKHAVLLNAFENND